MPIWNGKTRGGSFGYRFFICLIKYFGLRSAYVFQRLIVLYYILFAPQATRSSWFYWRKIHKKSRLQALRWLYIHYYRFGQVIIDKVAALAGFSKKFKYNFHNYDAFLDILNSDTGVVLIGAHFGSWKIGELFFGNYAKKINIVMYDNEYQKIKDQLEMVMGVSSYQVIRIKEADWSHIFAIKEALDRKEYVCFQGDRFINEKHVFKESFLGKEACFPVGPFQIASRFNVPVVFYFSERERSYCYDFRFFLTDSFPKKDNLSPAKALLHQYIEVLESRIKEHPEQWFNFYPFWEREV